MAFLNKVGSCNMTGSVDIVANSISLIRPDGTLQALTLGGTIAPANNPTFTGTVQGVTKATIGLSNVDNTSDLAKPVSSATQNALNTMITNTNTTFASHLGLINTNATNIVGNTASISALNASVNTLNSTAVAQVAVNASLQKMV